jgi:pimeloyl-ACP methyl ester carboxylesterase
VSTGVADPDRRRVASTTGSVHLNRIVRTMETIASADGTAIAFARTGNGPPLVLVHGGAAIEHRWWERGGVRPALAEHFTVHAVDRRGRGQSADAEEYALEREAEDLPAAVDVIDEPANLLGHSIGALFSLEAALRTDNLRTLILYEATFRIGGEEVPFEEVLPEIAALIDAGENEEALVLLLREIAGFSPEQIEASRSETDWQDRVDAAHTISRENQANAEYTFDPDRFADMTTPTLLLSGSESPPLFKAVTEVIDAALPNSLTASFDGHGHFAMFTATDRFIDQVLAFTREANE